MAHKKGGGSLRNGRDSNPQFRGVKSRPLPGGVIQIQLPKQGQSHGDILFAAVLAICQAADTFEKEPPPQAPKAQTYRSQMD
jgi:hypothetical protein